MQSRPFIVGIGGTTRSGSTSERALAVALADWHLRLRPLFFGTGTVRIRSSRA